MTTIQLEARKKQLEVDLVVASTMERLGAADLQISYAQACRKYGTWFKECADAGKITPCRIGKGTSPTRWFSVKSILAYQASEIEATLYIMQK